MANNEQEALKAAQNSLQRNVHDVSQIISQQPEQRHLACAFLAWQQLGHSDADSLYKFIVLRSEDECSTSRETENLCIEEKAFTENKDSETIEVLERSNDVVASYEGSGSLRSDSLSIENKPYIGPVVRLPVDTKIIMRVEASTGGSSLGGRPPSGAGQISSNPSNKAACGSRGGGGMKKDLAEKIEKACCLDNACVARLTELGASTKELRTRAAKLARREAERVELLERAEAAWRELEVGYQRRLRLALEKEQDAARQIKKMIDERNNYKESSLVLAKQLQDRGDIAENEKKKLDEIEKKVCALACERLKYNEESGRVDSKLADAQCAASQLDRDLQFKEEQARRRVLNMESELDSLRALVCEAQRAMRAELNGLRDQIKRVSQEFNETEVGIETMKKELADLRKEKAELTEDLEGCLAKCDNNMKKKVDALKKKTEELNKLKEKVMDCKCKLPTDAPVQVQRTASFAALCHCRPEDKFLDACSCTSLRTSLLSNMLSDLFGGLQTELRFTGSSMPCQLLKCLEDSHNWDSNSIVKTNLRNYFSKLLISELDIAIATAIENCHARWVGASCADAVARSIPDIGEQSYDWQQKAVERRAQTLANELAEEMFQNRAEELLRHTKEVLKAGPPPCECKPTSKPAVFTCIVDKPKMITGVNTNPLEPNEDVGCSCPPKTSVASGYSHRLGYWERTIKDVGQLKAEIEGLKKDSIKKQDLKKMEENIAKLVQRASGPDEPERFLTRKASPIINARLRSAPNERSKRDKVKEEDKIKVFVNDRVKRDTKIIKANVKPANPYKKNNNIIPLQAHKNPTSSIDKTKTNKKPGLQTYAVNYCMCGGSRRAKKNALLNEEEILDTYIKSSNDFLQEANIPSVRQSKPILPLQSFESNEQKNNKAKNKPSCGSNCVCFHKVPSNKSIDKLLETLMKWKCDLNGSDYHGANINCPYSIDSLINTKNSNNNELIQELVKSMSNAIKSKSMIRNIVPIGQESQAQKNYVPSTPKTLLRGNSNQVMERNSSLPMQSLPIPYTQSEYMGAVNLEKSNENNCKCTFGIDQRTKDMDVNTDLCSLQPRESRRRRNSQGINAVFSTTCITYNEDSEIKGNKYLNANTNSERDNKGMRQPDRYIDGKDMYYKASQIRNRASQMDGTMKNFLDNFKDIVVDTSTLVKNTSQMIENKSKLVEIQSKNLEIQSKNVEHESIDCHRNQTKDINQIIKPSKVYPCDCDYDIKFLGVTLRDANENKRVNNEHKENANAVKLGHGLIQKEVHKLRMQEKSNMDFSQYYSNVTSKTSSGKHVDNRQNDSNHCRQQSSRLSNFNINEYKELFANLNKRRSNKDQALDTKSLAGTLVPKLSPCVCCVKDKDEAHNLEVNTFHLLKEHLRQKLDELKDNCQSFCIPPEEENKAFCLILEKIKQTISEAANQVICKCADGEPAHGTWNRAYSLLQEYLKTKINRVHCKCPYPIEYNETLVPDVSAKVCILIEKDFQRLKGLCKCLNKSITDAEITDKRSEFQLPVKDIYNGGKISKQVSNTSFIITQTVSAQVEPNLVLDSISNKVVQERIEPQSDIVVYSPENKEYIVSHATAVGNSGIIESKNVAPIPSVNINNIGFQKDDDAQFKENQFYATNVDKSQNKDNQLALPLIGYTVDCTCNKYLGPCVCSKATVEKNNRKIEEIWYDFLSTTNKNEENISYIMDNVKCTISKSVDNMRLHDYPADVCIHHLITTDNVQQVNRNVMDNNTSADNVYLDLVLKDSSQKATVRPAHGTTNTDVEDISNLESNNFVDGSLSELYEYVPQNTPDSSKSKSVHYPGPCVKRTKSEIHADNFSKQYLQKCDCSTVPICHVKMLVENIEKKLIESDCTCDSMNYKVCPIHSRKVCTKCYPRY